MTFLEVCQQVISAKKSEANSSFDYGIWRESWPQDMIIGLNDKRDAYAGSPGVSIFIDTVISRTLVLSLTKTSEVNYVGWLPSVDDLTATDWWSNIPQDLPSE